MSDVLGFGQATSSVVNEAGAMARLAMKIAFDTWLANKMDNRLREIAADQRQLADRQLKMGEELHARYINVFTPIEDKAAAFAITDWEQNRYKPQYALHQGRAKLDAGRAFGRAAGKLNTKFGRYTTGSNAHMIAMAVSEWGRIEVDMVNRAWRAEEAQAWSRDFVQWGRLQNVIHNGQKLPTQVAQDIAAAVKGISESNDIKASGMLGFNGVLREGADDLYKGWNIAANQERRARLGQVVMGGQTNGSLGGTGLVFDKGSFGREFNTDEAGLLGTIDEINSSTSLSGLSGITGETGKG